MQTIVFSDVDMSNRNSRGQFANVFNGLAANIRNYVFSDVARLRGRNSSRDTASSCPAEPLAESSSSCKDYGSTWIVFCPAVAA